MRTDPEMSAVLGQEMTPWRPIADSDLANAHPDIRLFHDYYEAMRRRRGRLPRLRAIDPVEIPRLLARLVLVDLYQGDRFRPRYRLTGTEIDRLMGVNLSGRFYDEVYRTKDLAYFESLFQDMVADPRPRYWTGRLLLDSRRFITVERLIFAFAEDGTAVDAVGSITARISGREH